MLELNFHSGSSIYSSQWFACLASHTSRSNSPVTHRSFPSLSNETDEQEWLLSGWCFGSFISCFFRLVDFMFLSIFLEFIMLFEFMAIYWIYDFGFDFWKVINGDFRLLIYLSYFEKYGCYMLIVWWVPNHYMICALSAYLLLS